MELDNDVCAAAAWRVALSTDGDG
ncbi:hypothetical protein LCGC14_3139390, partial [marine sediment metagenome]